ncbi:MAG: hypothetical protein VX466_03300 [Myxococcota bacterium]|nr:hypothetical protein [Myxococcota bacterium]
MPVLPIIDLLIFLGWTTLAAGGLLKAIYLATSYRPTLLTLTPVDLLLVALAFLGLALTLAARTWVRLNEPALSASRQASATREAHLRAAMQDQAPAQAGDGQVDETNRVVSQGQWQRAR